MSTFSAGVEIGSIPASFDGALGVDDTAQPRVDGVSRLSLMLFQRQRQAQAASGCFGFAFEFVGTLRSSES
jgi:hypothetical protein